MSVIHVGHIKSAVLTRFGSLVDLSDVKTSDPQQFEKVQLTRSLAAFCLAELADIDDLVAADCVVDGTGDNGIDAVYFDTLDKLCFVVQTKWIADGNGSVEVGDIHKFLAGFRDLLDAKFDSFNSKFQKHKESIFSALSDATAKFRLVLGYTGEHGLSPEASTPITQMLDELNSPTEMVKEIVLAQDKLHSMVAKAITGGSVNLEVVLRQWGVVEHPYLAYYGQVAVSDVASWGKGGVDLTAKNLRQFRGSTDVNEGITKTLKDSPQHFWYFNNGLTVICENLSKKPLGGNNNDTGFFECTGVSVVNGAQTVGTIAEYAKQNDPTDARVMVRLISLENCPDTFGDELTRAANTQNRIEKRDFAAQDPNQKRLKTDLFLENQREYAYQAGEKAPQGEAGCTLDEAAVAMACRLNDVTYAVQAKREAGLIFEDLNKPPYKLIFNVKTSALYLWQSVVMMREVEAELRRRQEELSGKDQLVAIHGNRFILHVVSQRMKTSGVVAPKPEEIHAEAAEVLAATIAEVVKSFSSAYPANLFKNATKCREIEVAISNPPPQGALFPPTQVSAE